MDFKQNHVFQRIAFWVGKLRFPILAILFFAMIPLFQKIYFSPTAPDATKFNRNLNKKISTIRLIMQNAADGLKKTSAFDYYASGLQKIDADRLKDNGYILLIYEKDTLRYWSDNSTTFPVVYSNMQLGGKVATLNNGVYVVENQKTDSFQIIGLILVKHKYQYANDYLTNDFESDFDLPSSMEISSVKLSFGTDINDSDGNFMFSLSNRFQSPVNDNPFHYILLIFYFLGIIFVLMSINELLKWKTWLYLPVFAVLIAIRILLLVYKFPLELVSLSIFQPVYFSDTLLARSLGDMLINVLIVYLFTHRLAIPLKADLIRKLPSFWPKVVEVTMIVLFLTIIFVASDSIRYIIEKLVGNSKIMFDIHRVQFLSAFTFVAIFIISIVFASFKNIVDTFINYLQEITNYKVFSVVFGVFVAAVFLPAFFVSMPIAQVSVIQAMVITGIVSYIVFSHRPYRIYTQTLIMAIFAAFTVYIFYFSLETKDQQTGKNLISKIAFDQDMVTEQLLREMNDNIYRDDDLKKLLEDYATGRNLNQDQVYDYMKNKYFSGYLEKYEMTVTLCGNTAFFSSNNSFDFCRNFHNEEIVKYKGKKITDLNYHFINDKDGRIGYLGALDFALPQDSVKVSMYISLLTRFFSADYHYPAVLLEKQTNDQMVNREYSYAKYIDGQLINKSGEFNYDFNLQQFGQIEKGISFKKVKAYDHIINTLAPNTVIVISKASRKPIDLIVSFSYIFVFFNFVYGLVLLLKVPNALRNFVFDYKTKIQLWMVVILILSFISVGGGTVYYTSQQFENRINKDISERTHSVHNFFNQQFSNATFFLQNEKEASYQALTDSLTRIAKIFFTDINLYSPNGDLIATSRPEIFNRNLLGPKMNSIAFTELTYNRRLMFFQDEQIGKFGYTSTYITLLDENRKTVMYMNLPYHSKPEMIKNERSVLIVTVINLYVFLFLFTLSIAVLMANKITQPLRILLEKFKKVELGKHTQQIHYKSKDEVGMLVNEYNRMVEELAKNIDLLARSEREMAWREMAKQIAHEIKNPLTPMKLSVQYLLRAWQQRDQNFEKRFDGVTKTMIENIENLSRIATEFSSFAKMPTAINEEVNIVEKVMNTVRLFEHETNVSINLDLHENHEILVWVDKEQISRVFINLVKNAIQAIPENRNPMINIEVLRNDKRVIVVIEDNGTGIPEEMRNKIFSPNFTTKNSGTGLGLAIVKNIVEHANGKIWFETEPEKGTRFYVEIPVLQKLTND